MLKIRRSITISFIFLFCFFYFLIPCRCCEHNHTENLSKTVEKYDYLVVGTGLFGSVFAHEASSQGKKCLVIDKRDHIGGNLYTEITEGIVVHKYGPHIFHTNNKEIWNYINKFAEFNNFINTPIAVFQDEVYNLPFNMNTFNKLWGIKTPEEAKNIIDNQKNCLDIKTPCNLEEQAISMVGTDIYNKLIKGYTEKQWNKKCSELPVSIIKRLPIRFVYNNNYYDDKYQGVPVGGYTPIIEKLLKNSDVLLDTDYFDFIDKHPNVAKKIIYTGEIDRYFNYSLGKLEYRSLKFETEILDTQNFQGNAVVNYTESEIPYTRIIEHKHFEFGNQPKTVITKEYPAEFIGGQNEPFYPINDEKNNYLYSRYKELSKAYPDVVFCGRLGDYKYFDMDKTIENAINLATVLNS